jgi:RHS repeat-associated protein
MEASSGIMEGLLALPSGGGALRAMGERFQPDLLRGTGNYSIPISTLEGPNRLKPDLRLRYSTGQGNGSFGLGWRLNLLEVRRRTDRGVPNYGDDDEFILGESDIMIHVEEGRYRPRSDTQFWDIRREGDGWVIRTKEGCRYVLGSSTASRIAQGEQVFAWLLDTETDAAGNEIHYTYQRRDNQLYLHQVSWSIYSLRFVYEERPDTLHDGRAGFPIRTIWRCAAIELCCERLAQPVLKRYNLRYTQASGSGISLLTEVRLTGFDETGNSEDFPAIRLTYSQHRPDLAHYLHIGAVSATPPSLDNPDTTLVDMTGDGLPDVLQTGPGGHRFWPNKGNGTFGDMRTLDVAPVGLDLSTPGVSFADMNGDGAADLFRVDTRLGIYVANTAVGAWAKRPTVYRQQLNLRLSATDTRLVDLDGDGVVDLLQSCPHGFLLTYNQGSAGWSRPQTVHRIRDVSRFPDVDLGSPQVRLADMTGDGLTDIVFVDSGRVEYWPYYGYGCWGERVRMKNVPVLPPRYDLDRLFLSDIDGDGTADLLYVDFDRVYYWFNQSGQGWSSRYEVPFVPPPNLPAAHMADLLGNGTRGLVWSGVPRRNDRTGYRYLDLGGGVKPYLLTRIDDGIGGITDIHYTTSTALRRDDADAGEPWESYLPFPVHVVVALEHTDLATGCVSRTRFRYHRGYYDGHEREFRGFERVEVEQEGDASFPTVIQETMFYQSAQPGPLAHPSITAEERAEQRALAGSPIETKIFEAEVDGTRTLRQSAKLTWAARLEFGDGQRFVHSPHLLETVARDHAPGEPDRIDRARYTYDAYGNVICKERIGRFSDQPESEALYTEQRLAYTADEAAWLVGLPASIETRDRVGHLLSHTLHYYDGLPLKGLSLGQATTGLLRRTKELMLADWALPDGYVDEIDPAWGLEHRGEGYYRTTVAYDHDAAGNVTTQRDGLDVDKTIVYDSDNLFPVRMTDVDGLVTETDFDRRTAQPIEVRLPDGTRTRYRYSPLGRLRAQYDTAPDGTSQLTQVFDVDIGDYSATPVRPARIASIRCLTPGRTLDEFEDITDMESLADVNVACDYYDSDGNLLQRLGRGPDTPDGSKRWVIGKRRDYNVHGHAAADYPQEFAPSLAFQPTAPTNTPVRFYYLPSGQMRLIEHPDGGRLEVRYALNRIEKWDATTALTDPPVVERYNAWGHLTEMAQPDGAGNTVIYHHTNDELGRPTQVEDASGRILMAYTYAGSGPAIQITHADAGRRTYWRDARGQLRLRTDSLGRRLIMDYDAQGRLTQATDATDPAAPVAVRKLTYVGSRLTEVQEGAIRLRYDYDVAGRPVQKEYNFDGGQRLTLQREYGLLRELRAIVYPDGTRVDFAYDQSETVRSASSFIDDVHYDAYASPIRINFAGGAFATYDYDPAMRRLQIAALESPAGMVRRLTFTHDHNGNIATLLDELPDWRQVRRFSYDRLYRLTRAETHRDDLSTPSLRDDHYAYTLNGDLIQNSEALTGTMVYGDPAHTGWLTQVQAAGAAMPTELAYDAAGRLTSFGNLTNLSYDIWDRLVAATLADGTTVQFEYDHQGARVHKTVVRAGVTQETRYIENLYEDRPDGVRIHVYLGRLLVATQHKPAAGAAQTAFVLTDHLGTAMATCDPSGTPLHNQIYTPFGLSQRAPSEYDRFLGLTSDSELSLAQFGARYYAPMLGRFITPDWFIIENPSRALHLPQGLNAYSYAINNPLAFKDATGLWFGIDDLIVAAVGFVVGFIAGTIYGLATGQGWNSLLIGLEAGLLGAAGAWLAWNTAGLALGGLAAIGINVSGGVAFGVMVGAAVIGGLNGVISGATRIYEWDSPEGWFAFLSDSTWGLIGTTLADLMHLVNWIGYGGGNYQPELSKRQNRHVYDGGFGFGNYAFTQGNVISNLQGRGYYGNLLDHEMLHVWQSRIFGPYFQYVYVAWLYVGFWVALVLAPFTDQPIGQDIMDVAYYNNPWETWAYSVGGTPSGGTLSWT